MTDQHVLELREDGWGLEHPVECKERGSLLDCEVHRVAASLMLRWSQGDARAQGFGRHIITLDDKQPFGLRFETGNGEQAT